MTEQEGQSEGETERQRDLTLFTFEELADEIERRCLICVIAIEKDTKTETGLTETQYRFGGGVSGALGLLVRMQRLILDEETRKP